jgi:hypothetical protein
MRHYLCVHIVLAVIQLLTAIFPYITYILVMMRWSIVAAAAAAIITYSGGGGV